MRKIQILYIVIYIIHNTEKPPSGHFHFADEAQAQLFSENNEHSTEGSTEDSTEDSTDDSTDDSKKSQEENLAKLFQNNCLNLKKLDQNTTTFSEGVNWFEAAHKCRALGGNLAGLQSEEELKAISEKLTNVRYWLEINDLGNEGVYKLLSSGLQAGFLNWHSNEPNDNDDNENCVELLKYGSDWEMNDNNCGHKFNFICEKHNLE
ncbi:C-type lectin 37Db-like [Drosophila innubila]|uniref:C-type lectin 37Db-like n=1 Tax=Drosophila innubila TaxID=198719 RepID=UPI00148E3036|nr:C-type lectin 37Db-like [Drosophila innubila]